MRGVHVHQHQPARILCQHIDAVQLGDGVAEGVVVGGIRGVSRGLQLALEQARRLVGARGLRIGQPGGRLCRSARKTATGDAIRTRRRCGGVAHHAKVGLARLRNAELGLPRRGVVDPLAAAAAAAKRRSGARRRRGRQPDLAVVIGMQAVAVFAGLACQAALHRVIDELVHRARLAEAHFDLGRVHVDVDHLRRQVQAQHVRREAVAMQDVLIGAAHGVVEQLVAHKPAVDEEILLVRPPPGRRGQPREAIEVQRAGFLVQRQPGACEVGAQHLRGARGHVAAVPVLERLAVVMDRNRDIGPRQRRPPDHLQAVSQLGLFRFEELSARWRVEVQVLHIDHRADPARGGLEVAGVGADLGGMGGIGGAAGQHEVRDRRDGRERLAPEAEREHGFQFVERGDLAGGVAREGHGQFVGRNAAAVVRDDHAPHAALLEPDGQLRGAGIECIFEQFLDHRGRPFDHFAGGDLADQLVRQGADGAAGLGGAEGVGRHAAIIRAAGHLFGTLRPAG
ncbi:hypothetical protein D3C81_640660 [compost metagenome]